MASGESEKEGIDGEPMTMSEGSELDGSIEEYGEKMNELKGELINKPECSKTNEKYKIERPTKREREEDRTEWIRIENKGKKQKHIKSEVIISSKEKLPKQFAIAKLFSSLGMADVSKIKYMNPYKLKIEVPNEECASKLLNCQEFRKREWRVQGAWEVNVSYGIIRDVDLDLTNEEALNTIKCINDIEIISIKRLDRRDDDGNWVPSESARVSFRGSNLPAYVCVGNIRIKVEPYIFPTTQCSKCWKFGHSKTRCMINKVRCPKCGERHENCDKTYFKCVNCQGNHMALDKMCPVYAREKRLRELMAEFNCTYRVACNMYVASSPRSRSDSRIVKENEMPTFNCNNRYSGLLLDGSENRNTYTPILSEFPQLFTPKRPRSPQGIDNKNKRSSNIGKSEWGRHRESTDRIPERSTDNAADNRGNNTQQIHFSELLTRLKDIIFMRSISIQEKIKDAVKCCIEWLVIIVVDNMSEWPSLNNLLELISRFINGF